MKYYPRKSKKARGSSSFYTENEYRFKVQENAHKKLQWKLWGLTCQMTPVFPRPPGQATPLRLCHSSPYKNSQACRSESGPTIDRNLLRCFSWIQHSERGSGFGPGITNRALILEKSYF
jgi:hypothetical protein